MFTELSKPSDKLKWWQVALPAGIVFFVAYAMHFNMAYRNLFLAYYSYAVVPFMVAVPVLLLWIRKVGGKRDEK